MLDKIVKAYGKAYPNLKVHAIDYPTPAYLKSISVMGQYDGVVTIQKATSARRIWKFRKTQVAKRFILFWKYTTMARPAWWLIAGLLCM